MALHLRLPYLLRLRLMASHSRFFPHSATLNSLSSIPRPSFFFTPRLSLFLRRILSGVLVRSVFWPRAFMSSSITNEAFQETSSSSKAYGSEQIQVLESLDPVRKRPGMHIGSLGPCGLHHLVYEILDNAVNEAQAGYATHIDVILHPDGPVSIADNGRGILDPECKRTGEIGFKNE